MRSGTESPLNDLERSRPPLGEEVEDASEKKRRRRVERGLTSCQSSRMPTSASTPITTLGFVRRREEGAPGTRFGLSPHREIGRRQVVSVSE